MAAVMVLPWALIRRGPPPEASAAAAMDTCTPPFSRSIPMVCTTISCWISR